MLPSFPNESTSEVNASARPGWVVWPQPPYLRLNHPCSPRNSSSPTSPISSRAELGYAVLCGKRLSRSAELVVLLLLVCEEERVLTHIAPAPLRLCQQQVCVKSSDFSAPCTCALSVCRIASIESSPPTYGPGHSSHALRATDYYL